MIDVDGQLNLCFQSRVNVSPFVGIPLLRLLRQFYILISISVVIFKQFLTMNPFSQAEDEIKFYSTLGCVFSYLNVELSRNRSVPG